MKTCPICKAVSFDDAEVCYGCLHRFEAGEDAKSDCIGSDFVNEVSTFETGDIAVGGIRTLVESSDTMPAVTASPLPAWDFTVGSSDDGTSIQITVKPRLDFGERSVCRVS